MGRYVPPTFLSSSLGIPTLDSSDDGMSSSLSCRLYYLPRGSAESLPTHLNGVWLGVRREHEHPPSIKQPRAEDSERGLFPLLIIDQERLPHLALSCIGPDCSTSVFFLRPTVSLICEFCQPIAGYFTLNCKAFHETQMTGSLAQYEEVTSLFAAGMETSQDSPEAHTLSTPRVKKCK